MIITLLRYIKTVYSEMPPIFWARASATCDRIGASILGGGAGFETYFATHGLPKVGMAFIVLSAISSAILHIGGVIFKSASNYKEEDTKNENN